MNRLSVEANGLAFECLRAGDGDRLALCLHGFPDDAGSMEPIAERLAESGWTAVAPYTRGYGATGPAPDGDYSAAALGRDAIALEAALSERFDTDGSLLVGHDWGAAAGYAADRIDDEAFDRIVAMAVPPGFAALLPEHSRQVLRSWYMWFFQLPDVPERALRWRDFALVEFLWSTWSPGWEYPRERIESVKETFRTGSTVENALQYYRDTVGSRPRELLAGNAPSIDERPRIETPTLVVSGADDGCIGPALFDRADEVLEECRVVRVRDAGHFVHRERPDVVGEEILEFVDSREGLS